MGTLSSKCSVSYEDLRDRKAPQLYHQKHNVCGICLRPIASHKPRPSLKGCNVSYEDLRNKDIPIIRIDNRLSCSSCLAPVGLHLRRSSNTPRQSATPGRLESPQGSATPRQSPRNDTKPQNLIAPPFVRDKPAPDEILLGDVPTLSSNVETKTIDQSFGDPQDSSDMKCYISFEELTEGRSESFEVGPHSEIKEPSYEAYATYRVCKECGYPVKMHMRINSHESPRGSVDLPQI